MYLVILLTNGISFGKFDCCVSSDEDQTKVASFVLSLFTDWKPLTQSITMFTGDGETQRLMESLITSHGFRDELTASRIVFSK